MTIRDVASKFMYGLAVCTFLLTVQIGVSLLVSIESYRILKEDGRFVPKTEVVQQEDKKVVNGYSHEDSLYLTDTIFSEVKND